MESDPEKYHQVKNKIVFIGFGSIGQAVLPLIFRHLEITPEQIIILTKRNDGRAVAEAYGASYHVKPLTKDNYLSLLNTYLQPGDFLLNLSVDVSSLALMEYCQQQQILYLDTCIEPWVGGYTDTAIPIAMRSNYALREAALALRAQQPANAPTAVVTHGANPGLVSYFVKQALLNMARDNDLLIKSPTTKAQWAQLAQRLNIKTIHIAERDTQITAQPKRPGEFVNTWSIDGFVAEGSQPAELGWGTHERHWPQDGNGHNFGCQAAIYLDRPGAATRVRTWTPLAGPFHGFLITHGESISIADYFTYSENDKIHYRPTVHYAYHPCEDAVLSLHELAGREWQQQDKQRLLFSEITAGMDELGVLLMGNERGAYWFGSQLSIEEARELAPFNTATTLQVAAGVLAGMVFALKHPQLGMIEPDEIDFNFIMPIVLPYLGKVAGYYTDWTPLKERAKLFPTKIDEEDPWQFINILVEF